MRKIIITFISAFFLVIISASAQNAAISADQAIRVVKSGSGDPILFLPGFTTPGSAWDETVKNLRSKHQSHQVTYAGFAGVPPIDTPWYPSLLRDLTAYIKANKLKKLTIIGHSMGGNLAVDLAADLPEYVSGLILVDALPCMREMMMPNVPASALQYKSPYNDQMINMKDSAFNKSAKMMAGNMGKQKLDSLVKWIQVADRKTYVYGYTDLLKLDLRPKLANVKAKTVILGASFPSAEVTKPTFEKQYANLAEKTIVIAPDSKHFIMFDQPEWFYQQVNNFLSK